MVASKSKAKTSSTSSTKSKGPGYFDLIKAAILELKERTGSSRHAITKYVSTQKDNFASFRLNKALRTGVENGKLIQVKGSYKLAASEKPKTTSSKKAASTKGTKSTKTASKKAATKKSVPAKKKTVTKKKAPVSKKTTTKKKPAASTKKAASSKTKVTKKSPKK